MTQSAWGEGFPREPITGEEPRRVGPMPDLYSDPEGYRLRMEDTVLAQGEQIERLLGPDGSPLIDHHEQRWANGHYRAVTIIDSPDGPVYVQRGFGSESDSADTRAVRSHQPDTFGGYSGNTPWTSGDEVEAEPGRKRIKLAAVAVAGLIILSAIAFEFWPDGDKDEKASDTKAPADSSQSQEQTATSIDPNTATQEPTKDATKFKFKVPGCSIASSVVHVGQVENQQTFLPSVLLEHLQKDNTPYKYNIPTGAKGDVKIMLCDSDQDGFKIDATQSTPEHAVYAYDLSTMTLVADTTGLSIGVAKEKPHVAYLGIQEMFATTYPPHEVVKVDGRHVKQDRRTVAAALKKNVDILVRQQLAKDAVASLLINQAPAAFEAYCAELASEQGYTAGAITCVPSGELPVGATDFAKGFKLASVHRFETPSDPNKRPVFVRVPLDEFVAQLQTESVIMGE